MSRIIVLGAGPIGSTTAQEFADRGDQVTVVTRSASGPRRPDIDLVALDAAAPELHDLARGADVIVNAINLPYAQWATDWPPLHRAITEVAERSGAVLALIGNLYGYAAGASPMTPDLPLDPPTRKGAVRAAMWEDLAEATRAGRLRALELRASDYVGPQVTAPMGAHAGPLLLDPVLAGRRAWVMGDPDAAHTWTSISDIARTTVVLAGDERAWGRGWHVPSAEPRSIRQVARDYATAAGRPEPTVTKLPRPVLRLGGLFQPQLREMVEMMYQFDETFVATHDETTTTFGVRPTPWKQTVAEIVAGRLDTPVPVPA
ncbi:NAD-dependent epimerase/dehydratase family protein [Propionibacteriaceae bacterium Y2011]